MKSTKFLLKYLSKKRIAITLLLFLGFLIRVYFVDKVVVGDLMNYAEWGEKLVQLGPKNLYFTNDWYYSSPNYPPASLLYFGFANWLNGYRYLIAELHNLIKFPPAVFIIYFYKWGYIFLLKMLPILSDLAMSALIYKLSSKFGAGFKKSLFSMCLYLFNPITIFISSAWGQTDSVVALLGTLSFVTLFYKREYLSAPLMFLSLYFKPSWAILGIFYIAVIIAAKVDLKRYFAGLVAALVLFVVFTKPFTDGNVFTYGYRLFREKYPLPIGIDGKASISAFNFQTIFYRIDIDYSHEKLLGIQTKTVGMILYILTNVFALKVLKFSKDKMLGAVGGIFIIGFGSFMFMATMLERYFFPGFAALFILLATRPNFFWRVLLMNLILALNILYSFYRRGSDEIGRPFVNNNFIVIRILSLVQTFLFLSLSGSLKTNKG